MQMRNETLIYVLVYLLDVQIVTFLSTKVSAFSPIVHIGQFVYNIFHASRMIVSIMYLYKQKIFFFTN